MLKSFNIHQPKNTEEALSLLTDLGDKATPYAGGTELLAVMREGFADYSHLLDLKVLKNLSLIELDEKIERSELILKHIPFLSEVEKKVANVRVRETGTIGGNLCFGDPYSDPATLIMAWKGAKIELLSPSGKRLLSPKDFLLEPYVTAREHNEIMTALILPIPTKNYGAAFQKFAHLERPAVNVAVFITKVNGKISESSLAVGSAGPIPIRIGEAESLLIGKPGSKDLSRQVGELASQIVEAIADHSGSAEYKSNLVSVLVTRATEQAISRA
jgi:carbon-monoxide dehydrogenase medium subunit